MVLILCPPRSYSSVICAMLGRHPELYGFPELALFVGDTLQDLLDFHAAHRSGLWTAADCSPGLLRALAQLLDGAQTPETVARARAWVEARRHWTTGRVCDFLLERVRPRLGIDKSPLTTLFPEFLNRAFDLYPGARFLHLTRHPVTSHASLRTQYRGRLWRVHPGWDEAQVARFFARLWCSAHRAILDLTRQLPPRQTMRIRGEDVLGDPDRELARVARWLGLRDDAEALAAMRHPERSPYAHFGPAAARGANDPKFLGAPRLRPAAPPPAGIVVPPDWGLDPALEAEITDLAAQLGYAPASRTAAHAA